VRTRVATVRCPLEDVYKGADGSRENFPTRDLKPQAQHRTLRAIAVEKYIKQTRWPSGHAARSTH